MIATTIFNGDGMLGFTEFWALLIASCTAVITISGAAAVLIKVWGNAHEKINKPNADQNKRIECLESKVTVLTKRVDGHDQYLENDYNKLKSVRETQRVTLKCLFAIMSYLANDGDKTQIQEEMATLNDYIFDNFETKDK